MARLTLVFGALFTALGIGGYWRAGDAEIGLIVPALFGLVLMGLGLAALKASWQRHAVYAALIVGLVGFLTTMPAMVALARKILDDPWLLQQSMMSVLYAVFLGACVRCYLKLRREWKSESK